MSDPENESSGGGPDGSESRSDGSSGNGSGGGGNENGEGPSTPEKVVTVVSVLFTLLLFAFLVSQALSVPAETTPEANVESVEELPGNRTAVTVTLRNPGNEGLLTATVAVDCTQPPPSIDFTHVPTDGRQTAVLVCPAGTAGNATANVTVWQEA